MTPNIDRNLAPETWITAAPMDTLTLRGPGGEVLDPSDPRANTIPVRFRLYWAGSDRDGAVTGYYWAVTETTTSIGEGEIGLPNLPGPKPQDYRFTPRTDTTFVFTVDQLVPDRQHAFFLYAVDNQGKPDPTPARFFFRAFDRFPPRAEFIDARATGRIVTRLPNGSVSAPYDTTVFLTDTVNIQVPPSQFVPANSRLDFAWRPVITLPGTYVTGYWYKLDETSFIEADSTVTSVSYNTGLPGDTPVSTGTKIFTLRAVSQSGSAGETTRRFVMNFPPTTWWYGPDTTLFANTPADAQGFADGRSALVSIWPSREQPSFQIAGTAMSPDSFALRPAERIPARKTFYELWKDRIWARSEFDTVHMNSWIVLWNGGFDADSPYDVKVDPTDPELPTPIPLGLTDAGQVGSPIGFKSQLITRTDPFGSPVTGTLTLMYPVYEPASVFRNTRGGGYWGMNRSGKAYAIARAEDFHGAQDRQVGEFVNLVEQVDASPGQATPEQLEQRAKVLTFYVNKNAVLLHKDPSFEPDSNEVWGNTWSFNLRGYDVDNYDWNQSIDQRQLGGPTQFPSFRFKVWVTGVAQNGRDTTWVVPNGTSQYFYTVTSNNVSFQVFSNPFASGPLRVWIELCDCVDCETAQGQGRCTTWSIPVNYTRTTPEDVNAETSVRPGEPSTRRSD